MARMYSRDYRGSDKQCKKKYACNFPHKIPGKSNFKVAKTSQRKPTKQTNIERNLAAIKTGNKQPIGSYFNCQKNRLTFK